SGNIDLTNSCQSEQKLSDASVTFTSQDSKGGTVAFTTLNNWWVNDTAYALKFASNSGGAQTGTITADNGKAIIKAGQTISFSGGINLNGNPFNSSLASSSFVVKSASAPVTTATVNVAVDTTDATCVNTTNCNGLNVTLSTSSGQSVANFTVPTSALGAVYTQPIANLSDGVSYTVSSSAVTDATIAYVPASSVTANATAAQTVTAKYKKVAPAISYGKALVSIPTVVANYSGALQVQLINTVDNSVVNSYSVTQGGSITTENIQASDATHSYALKLVAGIADPLQGLYYTQTAPQPVTITKGATTSLNIALAKTSKQLNNVTMAISGLNSGDNASVAFSDSGSKYNYVSYANQANSNTVYKIENGLNIGANIKASGSSYEANPIVVSSLISADATLSAAFKQQAVSSATYDYIAPFKDYNNKITLSVQGLASAKSVSFTSNFKQKDGWGTCFGQSVYGLSFNTTQSGNRYTTTITPQSSGTTLDLTKGCDIMGTDSGEAVVLSGVVDPIVYSVSADGKALKINQPCSANGCKDPGNGYVNAGYYAQWSVWGRQYNPYNMPFNNINNILYAFVGFNPADGSVKSLDTSADSWGMSAVSRALLQYPYMKAHLSFGGWTNNGVTTAPMFEQLASSTASMNNFATQAVSLMRKTGFTGIDIDWEWWSDYSNNAAPAKKMLAFYQILRTALDKAGVEDGKKYTLSIAVNAGSDRISALQSTSNPNSVANFWAQVGAIVDNVNIMSYDYHGSWDSSSPAYFQAAYDFSNTGSSKVGQVEGWSIKSAVASYTASGVPAKKLVVGIPLYARTMTVASSTNGGLLQSVTGAGFGDYENGILDYKCIVNPVNAPLTGCGSDKPIAGVKSLAFYNSTTNTTVFNTYGKDSMQPWAYSAQTNSFMTYDDIWSSTTKAKAVKSSALGGTMFWELDGDAQNAAQSIVQAVKDEYNR
ncbi:MAG: hypothetical protein RL154_1333, partial [Pseudomonadota bacterium]